MCRVYAANAQADRIHRRHTMSNEASAATDPTMFAAVFKENWDNARYIKSERISFYERLLRDLRGSAGPAPERSG